MISILILLFTAAIFLFAIDIRAKMSITLQSLADINESLKQISEHSNETELNTIKAINEMCNALNQAFSTSGVFMNHTSYALQNIAVCMIPFIDGIKSRAVADEEYEKAQECANIIKNLQDIIKQK